MSNVDADSLIDTPTPADTSASSSAAGVEAIDFSDDDTSVSSFQSVELVPEETYDHIEQNGYRYHKGSPDYYAPADEEEKERQVLCHYLWIASVPGRDLHALHTTIKRDLALAPISNPQRVLDIGAGHGFWAIEFGDLYPGAHVIGLDQNPWVLPGIVPPNVICEVDDIAKLWTYSNPFDYIHWRGLNGCLECPQGVIDEAYDHLKSGGWLELQDWVPVPKCDDETLKEEMPLVEWCKNLEASSKLAEHAENSAQPGRFSFSTPLFHVEMMEKAGFVHITVQKRYWATNDWPANERDKFIGRMTCNYVGSILEAHAMKRFTDSGMSKNDVILKACLARKDLRNTKIHAYFEAYVVYGQKP